MSVEWSRDSFEENMDKQLENVWSFVAASNNYIEIFQGYLNGEYNWSELESEAEELGSEWRSASNSISRIKDMKDISKQVLEEDTWTNDQKESMDRLGGEIDKSIEVSSSNPISDEKYVRRAEAKAAYEGYQEAVENLMNILNAVFALPGIEPEDECSGVGRLDPDKVSEVRY